MVSRGKPLDVPGDWQWHPQHGPREVLCSQCWYWVEWKLVTYKGCIENEPAPTSPSDVQTECCWCYAQREGLSYSEARSKYKNLVKAKRGDRVQSFHEAMAYTQLTSSSFSATHAGPEQKSNKDIRRVMITVTFFEKLRLVILLELKNPAC